MKSTIDLKKYTTFIEKVDFVKKTGRVNCIIGLVLEGDGPAVSVGSICTIYRRHKHQCTNLGVDCTQRNPKPKAADDSGSNVNEASLS